MSESEKEKKITEVAKQTCYESNRLLNAMNQSFVVVDRHHSCLQGHWHQHAIICMDSIKDCAWQ